MLKRVLVILFMAALLILSGCVKMPEPEPSETPTPAQTPLPTPTQRPPSTIGLIQSSQVVISDMKISYDRGAEKQAENYSVLFTNNGDIPAKNMVVSLRVSDARTDKLYFNDQFYVGEIPANQSRWIYMATGSHDYAYSVFVKMEWFWGDNLEFRNSFSKAFTLVYATFSY